MNKKIIVSVMVLLLLVFFVNASPAPSTSPCRIIGSVDINGTAAQDGLTIIATPSHSSAKSSIISDGNYDINAIGATEDETVTLSICGISTGSPFDFEPFCKTSETEPWIVKNIDFELQTDGQTGCTCDDVCEGGTCVNPGSAGVCSSEEYYCDDDGSCESDFGETTSTCSSDCHSASPGGSTRGNVYEPPYVSETSTQGTISDGGNSTFSFLKSSELAIISIEVTVNNATTNTAFTVTETSKPLSAPIAIASAEGNVYKYLQITSTIQNPNIKTSIVKFKVAKSWVVSDNIDPDRIYIEKLINDAWVRMDTVKTGEDEYYFYYEATVPSFSQYAIIGYKKGIAPPVIIIKTHTECSNDKCIVVQGEGTDACTADGQCKKVIVIPPLTHKACRDNKCISVDGGGADQCTDDNSCKVIPVPKLMPPTYVGLIVLVIIALLFIFFSSGSRYLASRKEKRYHKRKVAELKQELKFAQARDFQKALKHHYAEPERHVYPDRFGKKP